MESLCVITSLIPRLVCIPCVEMSVHFCVLFQYEIFCGYGLLAIVAVMNTTMSLCIPGYHLCNTGITCYVPIYISFLSYLVRCVGQYCGVSPCCIPFFIPSSCVID
jgi:hypothetical protein